MAKEMIDIALNEDDELIIAGGDFVSTESTAQHQRQLLLNAKGDFKQNPTICVGAFTYFDNERMNDLMRDISIEFSRDGMDVQSIRLDADGTIITDAFYK